MNVKRSRSFSHSWIWSTTVGGRVGGPVANMRGCACKRKKPTICCAVMPLRSAIRTESRVKMPTARFGNLSTNSCVILYSHYFFGENWNNLHKEKLHTLIIHRLCSINRSSIGNYNRIYLLTIAGFNYFKIVNYFINSHFKKFRYHIM